jgi:hypothetical protein
MVMEYLATGKGVFVKPLVEEVDLECAEVYSISKQSWGSSSVPFEYDILQCNKLFFLKQTGYTDL